MKRLLVALLAVACLVLGARWAPPSPAAGEWRPLVRALGPLRSIWADVLLVQFDERALHLDVFASGEQARRILVLRPDLPAYRIYFGQYLALDLANLEADPVLQRERVRQGIRILREGAEVLPGSPQVAAALADTLWALADSHPDWIEGWVKDPLGEALDAYLRADRLAPEALTTDYAFRFRLRLEGLLKNPDRLPGRAAEVRRIAEDQLRRPGLPPESATALRTALREALRRALGR